MHINNLSFRSYQNLEVLNDSFTQRRLEIASFIRYKFISFILGLYDDWQEYNAPSNLPLLGNYIDGLPYYIKCLLNFGDILMILYFSSFDDNEIDDSCIYLLPQRRHEFVCTSKKMSNRF